VNADYLGGLTFSYALDSLVFLARFFHQRSHLGAEFRPVTAKTKVRVQLLMAVDLQSWQQNDWIPDASFIAGATLGPAVQLYF
jgi:hypothetical protein